MKEIFAVFVLAPACGGWAATTRAADRGEAGRIGLPGGKVDAGESALAALLRESREEGWEITGVEPIPHCMAMVEGKLVAWYKAKHAAPLAHYKEKGRIVPVVASREEILASGYGNENLKI